MPLNANKPERWKADIAASVDRFNEWFMEFAPRAFRDSRSQATEQVRSALIATSDLRALDAETLKANPAVLPALRMCAAPPLAVDRLIGLSGASKTVVGRLEKGKLPVRMGGDALTEQLRMLCGVLRRMLDGDIFPWLVAKRKATSRERHRAATIVADRLCNAVANPIVRNAQEQRQLELIGDWLANREYRKAPPPAGQALTEMAPGTYSLRMNLVVGSEHTVKLPIDVVIQPKKPRPGRLPVLIEAKSAGDFTNTNKRRKEEATKIRQLKDAYGGEVCFVLFLCGYFGSDYLGYEAAEGIDWVWEHRIEDLAALGL